MPPCGSTEPCAPIPWAAVQSCPLENASMPPFGSIGPYHRSFNKAVGSKPLENAETLGQHRRKSPQSRGISCFVQTGGNPADPASRWPSALLQFHPTCTQCCRIARLPRCAPSRLPWLWGGVAPKSLSSTWIPMKNTGAACRPQSLPQTM